MSVVSEEKRINPFRPRVTIEEMNRRLEKNKKPLIVLMKTDEPDKLIVYCKNCKQTFTRNRDALNYAFGCPVCKGRMVIKGYNDFATKRPELMKFLSNKEDGYKYTQSSEKKVMTKCPDCGNERLMNISNLSKRGFSCPCKNKKNCGHTFVGVNNVEKIALHILDYFVNPESVKNLSAHSTKYRDVKCPDCGFIFRRRIVDIYKNGLLCPKCGDGVSYPNKFSRFFLSQLPIKNFIIEYKPEWGENRSYDNYFEYDGKCYILEMDGGFHYMETNVTSHKKVTKIDKHKDEMAESNGIIVIRIDCRKSNKDYIKNNILKSDLSKIFDLSSINWDYCDLNAQKSKLIQICKEYNKDELLVSELARKYMVNDGTVRKYLLRGAELGLCNIDENPHTRAGRIKSKRRNDKSKKQGEG